MYKSIDSSHNLPRYPPDRVVVVLLVVVVAAVVIITVLVLTQSNCGQLLPQSLHHVK